MKSYVSDRFDNNPKAKKLAERINDLGPWLYKSPWKRVSGKWVEDVNNGLGLRKIVEQKLSPLKTNIPKEEMGNYGKALKLLYSTGNYDRQEIIDVYDSLKDKKLVFTDGEWHFINKLNTNWGDITDLLVDLFIKTGEIDEISSNKDLKTHLFNRRGEISNLLDLHFKSADDYLEYTKNTKIRSAAGEESEDVIEGFLTENGFTIEYRGGNGDFIDMIFGADIIVKHPKHGLKVVQVKKSGPYWGDLEKYKVDWIGIGNGIKIYDKNTKEDITNTLIEDKGDEMVETFFDTGKLIKEIGDEETMAKLKKDFLKTEKKTFDDLVNNYEIGGYINQFESSYIRQKNTYVYDKDNPKLTLSSLNNIWEEIFKLVQKLYILDLYKNVGKPSLGLERDKRIGNYGSLIIYSDNCRYIRK